MYTFTCSYYWSIGTCVCVHTLLYSMQCHSPKYHVNLSGTASTNTPATAECHYYNFCIQLRQKWHHFCKHRTTTSGAPPIFSTMNVCKIPWSCFHMEIILCILLSLLSLTIPCSYIMICILW